MPARVLLAEMLIEPETRQSRSVIQARILTEVDACTKPSWSAGDINPPDIGPLLCSMVCSWLRPHIIHPARILLSQQLNEGFVHCFSIFVFQIENIFAFKLWESCVEQLSAFHINYEDISAIAKPLAALLSELCKCGPPLGVHELNRFVYQCFDLPSFR